MQENEYHLFDSDLEAFEHSKQSCYKLQHFHFTQGNIVRILLKNDLPKFDLIYSSGLFDYFDLNSSIRLVQKLWKNVLPGGSLIITNANPSSPSKFWMEYALDWYLIYKTKKDMTEIANSIEDIQSFSLEIDPYAVYQYLTLTKKA